MGKRGSDGKYWTPTIPGCVCKLCGVTYTGHSRTPQYCSKSCASTATAKRVKHTERTCPGCKTRWSAAPSNPSLYCSKECLFESGQWTRPRDADCAHCGISFLSRKRAGREDWEQYCSHKCAGQGRRLVRIEKICAQCGEGFAVTPDRQDERTCSLECRAAHYIRDNHHAWTGGEVLQNSRQCRRIDRNGYAAKYEGEHRLVAARAIGRPLVRGEVVICLDGNNGNFVESNLYLCPNQSEHGLIRVGAVEWPQASNLTEYRTAGYSRPSVILTLHEWENGRRPGKKGKWVTRHPQADEIIKRRRAGASIRTLAKDFGQGMSAMAKTVKHRL